MPLPFSHRNMLRDIKAMDGLRVDFLLLHTMSINTSFGPSERSRSSSVASITARREAATCGGSEFSSITGALAAKKGDGRW